MVVSLYPELYLVFYQRLEIHEVDTKIHLSISDDGQRSNRLLLSYIVKELF